MTWFKPTTDKFSAKVVFEEYVTGWVIFSSTWSSRQGVVCKRGNNIEDSGEKTSDSEDNSFEATILLKAKSKGTFNSWLKEKKRRNKWCCEEVDIPPKDF